MLRARSRLKSSKTSKFAEYAELHSLESFDTMLVHHYLYHLQRSAPELEIHPQIMIFTPEHLWLVEYSQDAVQ